MKKEKIEKYVDIALLAIGVAVFGLIMSVCFVLGRAILEAIF